VKKESWPLVGILIFLAGFVWTLFVMLPSVTFRYEHPKMTETELQIYFLSNLHWSDLCPAALVAAGSYLIWKSEK